MATKAQIEDFMAQRQLAVVGVSRDPRKFGSAVYKELKSKGYTVYAINPNTAEVDGDKCYATLADLPGPVGGVICTTRPAVSEQIVHQAAAAGIQRVWLQQGSESKAAVEFCKQNGIEVVYGECIFMFQPNAMWMHRTHRFVRELFGGGPK
jgi:uncharacterized protein